MYTGIYEAIDKTDPRWRARYDAGYSQCLRDTEEILKEALRAIKKLESSRGFYTVSTTNETL